MDESRRHDDLTAEETRVLGCLIEKEATTPDAYPLTTNSLRNACNQSTSRDPVMTMSDLDVEHALASLRARGLTRTVHSTSNRAAKYKHVVPDELGLDAPATALLSVLMLRGAQTIGELKSRAERQHSFASTDEVGEVLAGLTERGQPLVRRLDRRPGQKDARWVHLLSPPVDEGASSAGTVPVDPRSASSSEAVDLADPYGTATAEFYELLATVHWERTGLELLDLLEGVDGAAGPIVDVGAGTGIGLSYLRVAVPEADLYAIEPSKAMRTALHTRLLLDRAGHRRPSAARRGDAATRVGGRALRRARPSRRHRACCAVAVCGRSAAGWRPDDRGGTAAAPAGRRRTDPLPVAPGRPVHVRGLAAG